VPEVRNYLDLGFAFSLVSGALGRMDGGLRPKHMGLTAEVARLRRLLARHEQEEDATYRCAERLGHEGMEPLPNVLLIFHFR